MSWLKDYKRPNDKINVKISRHTGIHQEGTLYRRVGLTLGKAGKQPDGKSYIGAELRIYGYGSGLLRTGPWTYVEITSMATKASRGFYTPMGLFTYTRLPLP